MKRQSSARKANAPWPRRRRWLSPMIICPRHLEGGMEHGGMAHWNSKSKGETFHIVLSLIQDPEMKT